MKQMMFSTMAALLLSTCASAAPTPQRIPDSVSNEQLKEHLAAEGSSVDDVLNKSFAIAIQMMSPALPEMLNPETELYKVSASDREFTYWIRLVARDANGFDPDKLRQIFRSNLLPSICSAPDVVRMMGLGASYRYQLAGRDRKPITSVEFSTNDCTSS